MRVVRNAKDAIGGFLAAALEPMAQFGATLAKAVADGMTVMATYDERLQETGNTILASSGSYSEYIARVQDLNDQLPPLVAKFQPLSEGAYNAAKGLQAAGVAVDTTLSSWDEYNQALGMASKQGPEARAALEELAPALMEQAAASEEGRAKIDELLW